MLGNIFLLLAPFVYNRLNYRVIHSVHYKQYIQKFSSIFSSRDDLCEKWQNSKFETIRWRFKVVSATFLLICFQIWKKTFLKLGLQNLFLFLRKSNFRILGMQISRFYQIPKHKARNTFYWITWEVNTVCSWNLTSLCHIMKEKILQYLTSSRPFCVYREFSTTSIGKWNFEASYLY